jgi:drug/metabolite transporter (DMT)-like permease
MLNLMVVYMVWGSTYLFIRVAVREGSGFPPFAMAASRTLLASAVLFSAAYLWGVGLRRPRAELKILAASGILLWLGGNGLVTWSERHMHSGFAALIVGTAPMWPVLIESIIDKRAPSVLLILSLLVGFAGLVVLVAPVLQAGVRADALSTIALLTAAVSWSGGSLLLQRRPPTTSPIVISAYQQLFGGLCLSLAMLLTGEPWPNPTPAAWFGWGYLVIAGSLISFTSYVVAVRSLPISIVMTYAYVNPMIAVVLGWLVLDERITPTTLFGMGLILTGVTGVFWKRFARH